MIARIAIALTVLAGSASAEPARKRLPDRFAKAAGDAFAAAAAADAAGDLRAARAQYEKAQAIAPHASTVFNLADVERRLALLDLAIHHFELYLAMAPDASDRAEVEALIGTLAAMPGPLRIHTADARSVDSIDLASAYVFVDGDLRKKPGPVATAKDGEPEIIISLPPGPHVIDLVTPFGYAMRECKIRPGEGSPCELRGPPRTDGNVVVSGSGHEVEVSMGRRTNTRIYRRFELPAGTHRVLVDDRNYGCATVALDAPAAPAVRYVFVAARGYDGLRRCRPLEVKQQRLEFPR